MIATEALPLDCIQHNNQPSEVILSQITLQICQNCFIRQIIGINSLARLYTQHDNLIIAEASII